jgi:hypothetical protein
VKEAYDVLSDPKRRKLYDRLGKTGMKLVESPQEISPLEFLKNFQRNRGDVCSLMVFIFLIFAAIAILPILFCLKSDQTLSRRAPWMAIWTPMWIVDVIYLLLACALFTKHADSDDDDDDEENDGEGNAPDKETQEAKEKRRQAHKIPMHVKIINFVQTCLFILIQIFILAKLDHDVNHPHNWSWIAVFAPWICYEGITIFTALPEAFQTLSPPAANTTDVENGAGEDEQEALLQQLAQEGKYLESLLERSQRRHAIWNSLLRIWFAAFLSVELDMKVSWNWGLVMLPVWIYILSALIIAYLYRGWGSTIAEGLSMDEPPTTPRDAMRLQTSAGVSGLGTTMCFSQCVVLLMALLLVFRLQIHTSTYSTFLIIFPVFVGLGCCCCFVFCGIFGSLMVDTSELEQPLGPNTGASSNDRDADGAGGNDVEAGGYVAPIAVINGDSPTKQQQQAPINESSIIVEMQPNDNSQPYAAAQNGSPEAKTATPDPAVPAENFNDID